MSYRCDVLVACVCAVDGSCKVRYLQHHLSDTVGVARYRVKICKYRTINQELESVVTNMSDILLFFDLAVSVIQYL